MNKHIARRDVMLSGGALLGVSALAGCVTPAPKPPLLPPLRMSADRITRVTVCTRPFRADGPRVDVEQIGHKTVVHNYGHGGSGWSLSWGSSTIAVRKALATGATDFAVVGCGALGLTSATLLQRAGMAVTIYAKDRPPDVRSALATGVWSPDSRICLEDHATPDFKQVWEEMARTSYQTYQNYLGLPGDPIEWIDMYDLSDRSGPRAPQTIRFARLQRALLKDMNPPPEALALAENPFPGHPTHRSPLMMFNITAYAHLLMSDFLESGGHIETREFHSPADFAGLRQKTLVNATGYGARALLGDETLTPVRGQLARLVPQPEVNYGLYYDKIQVVPRRDGVVVQAIGADESAGFGDDTTVPDRAEAERAVAAIAGLYARPAGT